MTIADRIQYFEDSCPTLLENGFIAPLPLKIMEKKPAIDDWTTIAITPELTSKWLDDYPNSNVGLRTGDQTEFGVLAAVDVDIKIVNPARSVLELLRYFIGDDILVRIGESPKFLVPIRVENPFYSAVQHLVQKPGKGTPKIELLCTNKQFVAFGIHPDTKQEYRWLNERSPLNVPFNNLPLVSLDILQSILFKL